jgi:hypothetical protein
MRRFALIGLVLLLPGCTGFADFMGDTLTYGINPNSPVGDSENMRRARGLDAEIEPLTPEPGNIWPGPVQQMPTLQDLEKSGFQPPPGGQPYSPDHRQPVPRGSSTPPGNVEPGLPPELQPRPPSVSTTPPAPNPSGRVVQTPSGPGVTSGGTSGYQTLTSPEGSSVVVPNGNGTSTVIHPNGTVETIPTPR